MKPLVEAATDGSKKGRSVAGEASVGPGGWAWYIDEHRWASGGEQRTTNNAMELMAVYELLSSIDAHVPLRIYVDSAYALGCLTEWGPKWDSSGDWRNSKKKPVANRLLIEAGMSLLEGRDVEFVKIRGHAGHPLNEAADQLAHEAALEQKYGS